MTKLFSKSFKRLSIMKEKTQKTLEDKHHAGRAHQQLVASHNVNHNHRNTNSDANTNTNTNTNNTNTNANTNYKSPFEMPVDDAPSDCDSFLFPSEQYKNDMHNLSIDNADTSRSRDATIKSTNSKSRDANTNTNTSSSSTMSFGSFHADQDSFAAVSHTGLSDDESSINSRYLDQHLQESERERERGREPQNQSQSQKDVFMNRFPRNGNDNKTSTLPRLTIQTRQTKALLAAKDDINCQNQAITASPTTVITRQLDPPTIASVISNKSLQQSNQYDPKQQQQQQQLQQQAQQNQENDNEFPSPSQACSPEFYMPTHLQQQSPFSMSLPSGSFDYNNNNTNSYSPSVSLSSSFLKERQLNKESKTLKAAYNELQYWENQLDSIISNSNNATNTELGKHSRRQFQGAQSIQAAHGMMNLGASLLRCRKYPEALSVYKNAVSVYRLHHGEHSLMVAKGLDKVGLCASLCYCSTPENLDWAYLSLKESLQIRLSFLGPHHVDCVDTLNNIAGVFLQRKEWIQARDLYKDVLNLRAAIFGKDHASIAITAQTLGKIYFQLRDFEKAILNFELALRIYKSGEMNLKKGHPLVLKVMKYVDSTQRMILAQDHCRDVLGGGVAGVSPGRKVGVRDGGLRI